ncbi:MAG: RIP metalloprotease RseP [Proteobacteria bacterium]|nr:RIP metalloprotease RseP [Pseudomonadota bacterium]NOG60820.1 RIP metalloprotease RseP [Pseudomonadota bacterium]
MNLLQNIGAFIVALGVLITFHEFGHYWIARRCDVKILRFSIGFGRAIYKRTFGKDNTEFVIAALPLGGYVKMLDEREGEVKEAELPRSFNYKPLWQRFAIVSAGPIFNFIFAIFAYWIIFIVGVNGLKPFIGKIEPSSISAQSGLESGQEILSINGLKTPTWSTVIDKLVNHTVNGDVINMDVVDNDGVEKNVEVDLSSISIDDMAEGKLLNALGLSVIELKLPPIIGEVLSGGSAEKSGLRQYDEIISVDKKIVKSWKEWVDIIRKSPGKVLDIEVLRDKSIININVTPERVESDNKFIGRIGAAVFRPDDLFESYFTIESYSLPDAFVKASKKTWEMSVLTLRVLGKMLVGEASVKNLSGPISIAQYAGKSAGIGLIAFLSFMAIVSVSLGVLNLLPVPLLDGGHLMYYLIELVIGKPVSEAIQIVGQQVGLVLLLGLMSIALFNDITRLFG